MGLQKILNIYGHLVRKATFKFLKDGLVSKTCQTARFFHCFSNKYLAEVLYLYHYMECLEWLYKCKVHDTKTLGKLCWKKQFTNTLVSQTHE